ncbi:hypothetical protein A8F94_02035 [Bacillus sp. FJAT-27225]|uniref:DinB family protein n=1 Tax=Bacillus sp. FJAT-27225 TaxID=1743144 RepID=UPI00080C2A79|nr:DinB family protein [Bacillus sp. FJAT-27225]OCA90679.1 hypothetical protein A8F94_02035 [Bacillus sp. FJAT-27225]
MKKLFEYNWEVRKEWLEWCKTVPEEELHKKRTGGLGTIYRTLLHIIEVEGDWMKDVKGEKITELNYDHFRTVDDLIHYSDEIIAETEIILSDYKYQMDNQPIRCANSDGSYSTFAFGEILRHVIAHEIHHMGQLSIWAREVGKKPINANLVNRGLYHVEGEGNRV